jgi:hypothetical protein
MRERGTAIAGDCAFFLSALDVVVMREFPAPQQANSGVRPLAWRPEHPMGAYFKAHIPQSPLQTASLLSSNHFAAHLTHCTTLPLQTAVRRRAAPTATMKRSNDHAGHDSQFNKKQKFDSNANGKNRQQHQQHGHSKKHGVDKPAVPDSVANLPPPTSSLGMICLANEQDPP